MSKRTIKPSPPRITRIKVLSESNKLVSKLIIEESNKLVKPALLKALIAWNILAKIASFTGKPGIKTKRLAIKPKNSIRRVVKTIFFNKVDIPFKEEN